MPLSLLGARGNGTTMKIVSLQLSNILSFKYVQDISAADPISFSDDLNIIIGENGAGKSTVLEVINFLFKRVLYRQFNLNQDFYTQRGAINLDQRRQILLPSNQNSYQGFRLDANWNSEDLPQAIRIKVRLDAVDERNLQSIDACRARLMEWIARYTTHTQPRVAGHSETYTLDVKLNRNGQTFSVEPKDCARDAGYEYLSDYNFYKDAIYLYNIENTANQIDPLFESFTLISSYRNYHAFNISVSLRDQHAATQIRSLRSAEFARSVNASDNSEPSIFALVRLRVADEHFGLISQKKDLVECEREANELPFIKDINERLRIVNLSCKIRLLDLRTWQYSFEFLDLRRNIPIRDINSLSAGQKAITHLVFEAYGRGDLKGGVVIIDEPEIHLHYQFQHEYLQVIRDLNRHQNCQYILVTHSEALINSSTISSVRRFSLNASGHTEIRSPQLTVQQKLLIRILDNTRSTYAFFAKKVVLVEGDSDRYFFKAMIQVQHPALDQEIAVLHVAGKGELRQWTTLFEAFGLIVYRVADLDYSYDLFYQNEQRLPLKSPNAVAQFRLAHPDCDARIQAEYSNRTFILKHGDLEQYLNIEKDLADVISFCANRLALFLQDAANSRSLELREILARVAA